MPFVEIGNEPKDWVKFGENKISISKNLRNGVEMLEKDTYYPIKFRLFYDASNKLFGIQPDLEGYKIIEGRLQCRRLPSELKGKYEAEWNKDKKMIIVNLQRKI